MTAIGIRRKMLAVFLAAVFALAAVKPVQAAFPKTVETVAEGYVVYDATTGQVILGKNESLKFYPASITKIMTALLVCEMVADLDAPLAFSAEAMAEMTSDSSTLSPMASTGETMTIRDALYGMFYVSANECAAQLAITVAGSRDSFTQMMNERAAQIGCTDTHFVNAHGLHDAQHFTTPYDMALITSAALANKTFFEMATGGKYTIPPTNVCAQAREMEVSHKIVNGMIPYAEVFAGKTGRTPQALRTLVTAAQFEGHTVVVVIMKSSDDEFYNDTLKLLEYARGYIAGLYTSMEWTEGGGTKVVAGTNSLKVRDYPSQSGSNVVGSLEYGQQVEVTGTWGEWSQISYMDALYYVYSEYLADELPQDGPSDETPSETQPVSIEFPVITIATTEADTRPVETVTVSTAEQSSSDAGAATYNVLTLSSGDETGAAEKKSDKTNLEEGPIKTIMIVCIILMVLIAAVAVIVNLRQKQKMRRRREMRRRRREYFDGRD